MEKRAGIEGARRRGAALLYAMVIAMLMGGLALALVGTSLGNGDVRAEARSRQRAFYAAEAGLHDAMMRIETGLLELPLEGSVFVGGPDAPLPIGSSAYWVEVSVVDARSRMVAATGVDGRATERLGLVLAELPSGFFQYAAFGNRGVILDSNAFIDSYDSLLGDYESQVQGGNEHALQNGHIGSNGDIILKANTQVHGDARSGPGGRVSHSGPNIYVSGSTEPSEEPVELPPIEVPSVPSSGALVATSDVVLGPGDVHYDSILMGGGTTLTIRGPARLIADDFEMKSNTNLVFDSTDGPIELYATGDFVLQSNSQLTTLSENATDVTLLLAGDNLSPGSPDSISLGANAAFVGAIYAPQVGFRLASNFDIYGSIMCGYLDLSSFGEIHFDEALLYDGWGSSGEFEPVLWRKLPRE